ncbi:hypothetical protein Tco_0714636 [Tanacetum coccineum]
MSETMSCQLSLKSCKAESCLLHHLRLPTHNVYTDSEPGRVFWGADEELSDGGPEHPPSPDYVPGPQHPPSPVEPYLPDAHRSPSQLRGGIRDPEEDPEEDFEEDYADYLADGGDDDDEPTDDEDGTDDEDEEPFEDEEDNEEEEERLALADLSSTVGGHSEVELSHLHIRGYGSGCSHNEVTRVGEEYDGFAPRPTGGHGADYGFIGTMNAEIRRQRAEEVGYGIRDVWVDPSEAVEGTTQTTLEGVNDRVTELAAVQEQDTQDIYAVIEDTQDRQTQIYQRVDILAEDRQFHYETARLLDQEALVSREAWTHFIRLSMAVHYEL